MVYLMNFILNDNQIPYYKESQIYKYEPRVLQ